MSEKDQVIEHDDGSADIIYYDESPSGYPRPCVSQLTKKGYDEYKRDNMNELGIMYVIPCKNPGLSCCPERMASSMYPADNVCRCEVFCRKWRQNRIKDRVFCACDKEHLMPGE